MTAQELVQFAHDQGVQIVDYRYVDPLGTWNHYSVPIRMLTEETFEKGVGFDGSSIRCWQGIEESDMLLIPDPDASFMDPFSDYKTLNIICDVIDPITHKPYERSPRLVARRAVEYMRSAGVADTAYFGPEPEFHVFDEVRYHQDHHSSMHFVECTEAFWNTSREDKQGPGHMLSLKGGYAPTPPADNLHDLRSEILILLADCGILTEAHHHEVGAAGQCEVGLRFQPLLQMADAVMTFKYVVRSVAYKNGRSATFMPKPIYGDNGSGMHCHQSLWKDGTNLMFDEKGYAGLSELAVHYIGGLLHHAPALLAFCAPTTNSYHRLVPGYEAPIYLVYSQRNRSACVRIPTFSAAAAAKRIEFRAPDPAANPYLAFAAQLMAGLDGIRRGIVPPEPVEKDVYHLPAHEAAKIGRTPGSLEATLSALEQDNEFLTAGGVFAPALIEAYIDYKRQNEVFELSVRPHPYEFMMYYGG